MIDFDDLIARNVKLGAFVDFDRDARPEAGPLCGVTVGIKANIAVRGLPWTGGMAHRRGTVADGDAAVVAKLRGAGATILGTLNMHEAALGATTDNPFYGRTHNPHRIGHTPGGSSGGSGAAVAAGLCDVALGTDTLGSIRIPAAYCGIYGLKPTAGAVDEDGLLLLDARLDTIGPLARDLDMIERVWDVIGWPGLVSPFAKLVTVEGAGGVECQQAVLSGYDAALAATGLAKTSLWLPAPLRAIRRAALAGVGASLSELLGSDLAAASAELQAILAALARIDKDPALLDTVGAVLIDTLGNDGVLVMPTTPQVAFAHGSRPPDSQADFSGLANISGLPALAVPAGVNAGGLPVSVQLVGPAGSESRLIALARNMATALPALALPFHGESR